MDDAARQLEAARGAYRRRDWTTWRRMRSPGPGPRRSGWLTSASRSTTWPGSRPSDPFDVVLVFDAIHD